MRATITTAATTTTTTTRRMMTKPRPHLRALPSQTPEKWTSNPSINLILLFTIMIGRLRNTMGHWVVVLGIIFTGILAGCQTGSKYTDLPPEGPGNRFHIGDLVTVSGLSGF